ncbi:HTH-type transcriptional regulator ArgP [Andreprevotia sp. IGB-42]|uniref:LysR family transcriptional regulator ArgP n=1 Tax=Andreprevotia sp. IGB-42 TaxID=2497473 RepID=UPI001356EFC7|nr:LysR family transcriptional regulator ArgP [Andreprevotia sp. IGB-42]KAF0814103.1 HTH-type transcriptional regulator ArgP [Andreprevotia sp. IGB-42]
MLDYKLLEALEMVALAGSFDGAARRLNLTQSAISQRIRQLEERHGCVLLARDPVHPTAAGERLLAHVRQVRQLEAALRAEGDEPADTWVSLPVGINADSLALGLIAGIAPVLAQARLLLDCVIDDEAYTLDLLRSGAVLGCIATQAEPVTGCAVMPLGTLHYLPVAAPAFARQHFPAGLTTAALTNAPAAVFGHRDSLHRRWLRDAYALSEGSYPCHVIPDSNALYALAIARLAYAVAPQPQVADALTKGELIALGDAIAVPLYWHHWAQQTQSAAQLATAIAAFATSRFAG